MNRQSSLKIWANVFIFATGLAAGGTARAGCDAEIMDFCNGWAESHVQFSIPECANSFRREFSKGKTAAQTQFIQWVGSRANEAELKRLMRVVPLYACASSLADNQSVNLEEGRRAREEENAAQRRRDQEAYDNAPKGRLASVEEGQRKSREQAEREANAPKRQPAPCPTGPGTCGVR